MKKLIIGTIIGVSILLIIILLTLTNLSRPVIIEGEFKNVVESHKTTQPGNYNIDTNLRAVYTNTKDAYISASPDTIKNPGWVSSIVYLKNYEGNVDVVFKTDHPEVIPTVLRTYDYSTISIPYSYECVGTYEISKDVFSCYALNGSLLFSGVYSENDKNVFYWEEEKVVGWVEVGKFAQTEKGMYVIKNVVFSKEKYYDYQYYLKFPDGISAKYDIAFIPSEENIKTALSTRSSYVLDPWVDSTASSVGMDYLDNGLIGYWKFDATSGVNPDEVGSADITYTGTWTRDVDGILGKGDYTTDSIGTGNFTEQPSQGTINFWFNSSVNSNQVYVSFGSGSNDFLLVNVRTNAVEYQHYGGPTQNSQLIKTKSGFAPFDSNWHMVTVTNDGTTKIYFDGTELPDTSTSFGNPNRWFDDLGSVTFVRVSQTPFSDGSSIQGIADELGVWERALNSTEITDLYNSGAGITYVSELPPDLLSVSLVSPEDNQYLNYDEVDFVCSGSSNEPMVNLTLIINDTPVFTTNETNPIPTAYYTLNEDESNTLISDWFGLYNGTSTQNTNLMSVTGKINNAISFNGVDDTINFGDSEVANFTDDDNFSVSFWVKINKLDHAGSMISKQVASSGATAFRGWNIHTDGTDGIRVNFNHIWNIGERILIYYNYSDLGISSTNEWYNLVLTYDGSSDVSGVKLYSDTEEIKERTILSNNLIGTIGSVSNFTIGSRNHYDQYFNGSIDDVRLYDVVLTDEEIISVYNSGETVSSIILNETITMNEGSHNWTCEAFDTTNSTTATLRNLFIDTTPPVINEITYPLKQLIGVNNDTGFSALVKANITEENIDTCWVFNGTTNVTLNQSTNCLEDHYLTFPIGRNEIIYYVNDTAGNQDSMNHTFFINNINSTIPSFDNPAIEGIRQTFRINITYDDTFFDSVKTTLRYNVTNYNVTHILKPENFISEWNITTPGVNEDTQIPYTYSIAFEWENATGTHEIFQIVPTSTPYVYYHNITNLLIDDCTEYVYRIYNFTIVDEKTQTRLTNNITIESYFDLWNHDITENIGEVTLITNLSEAGICINQTFGSTLGLYLDGKIRYEALNHDSEYYHIEKVLINNESGTRNITLYNIHNDEYTKFQITVYDTNSLPLTDALVFINREYVSENTFKTVSIPKTDEKGQTTAHLSKEGDLYNFIVVKDGEVLKTMQKIPICQVTPCELSIYIGTTAEQIWGSYYDYFAEGITSSLTYNKTTKMVEYTFIDTTGTADYFRLVVKGISYNQTTKTVCDTTTYSTAGIIRCNMTGQTGEYIATTYISRSPPLVNIILNFVADEDVLDYLGQDGLFLVMMLFIMIVFAGAIIGKGNPSTILIFLALGILITKLINIFPFGWVSVVSLQVFIFYLLYKLKT